MVWYLHHAVLMTWTINSCLQYFTKYFLRDFRTGLPLKAIRRKDGGFLLGATKPQGWSSSRIKYIIKVHLKSTQLLQRAVTSSSLVSTSHSLPTYILHEEAEASHISSHCSTPRPWRRLRLLISIKSAVSRVFSNCASLSLHPPPPPLPWCD